MKPFEWIFKRGFNLPDGDKNIIHVHGSELTDEEKKLLSDYCQGYIMELHRMGKKPEVIDTYLSGFYAGLGHAGTHFRDEAKP